MQKLLAICLSGFVLAGCSNSETGKSDINHDFKVMTSVTSNKQDIDKANDQIMKTFDHCVGIENKVRAKFKDTKTPPNPIVFDDAMNKSMQDAPACLALQKNMRALQTTFPMGANNTPNGVKAFQKLVLEKKREIEFSERMTDNEVK